MMQSLLLSRSKLATFLACRRRFDLRYLRPLPWPKTPLPEKDAERMERGQQFHQLLERHFLGLPVETAAIADRQVRVWWRIFQRSQPPIPNGRPLPELTLTIPIGNHLLNGRFDLLVISEEAGRPSAYIFDWKTGKPQEETRLRHDWQTRLYLAMVAEGGQALGDNGRHTPIPPENIHLTYWYVHEPDTPRNIAYSQQGHKQNWTELQAIVTQIDDQLAQGENWPLTEDLTLCRTCAYQAFCGRQEAGQPVTQIDEDAPDETAAPNIEPALP
ncbi:MAG: PD-(D/E)XK nuclease family protein [Chloroflexi bacterium]|nr:PD-(D/E)XK nuclease family protein [Chloroflexota bacterium]